MKKTISKEPSASMREVELGKLIGRREAFGLIAGRCSAADAECLRQLRHDKKYKDLAASWEDFCARYLGMSSRNADRTIRLLEELGPGYFEMSQLTRIAPEEFRAIAPALRDRSLHVNGEAIALIPENTEKIAAAVKELRKAPDAPAASERLRRLERRCDEVAAEFGGLSKARPQGIDQEMLVAVFLKLSGKLARMKLEMGI